MALASVKLATARAKPYDLDQVDAWLRQHDRDRTGHGRADVPSGVDDFHDLGDLWRHLAGAVGVGPARLGLTRLPAAGDANLAEPRCAQLASDQLIAGEGFEPAELDLGAIALALPHGERRHAHLLIGYGRAKVRNLIDRRFHQGRPLASSLPLWL